MDCVLYCLETGVALPDLIPEAPITAEIQEPVREAA